MVRGHSPLLREIHGTLHPLPQDSSPPSQELNPPLSNRQWLVSEQEYPIAQLQGAPFADYYMQGTLRMHSTKVTKPLSSE